MTSGNQAVPEPIAIRVSQHSRCPSDGLPFFGDKVDFAANLDSGELRLRKKNEE